MPRPLAFWLGALLLAAAARPAPGRCAADHYRDTDEIQALLEETAFAYPQIAALYDYGDSYLKVSSGGTDGYDLLALRITNQAITADKPVFFLAANYHGRELPSYEVALRWIEWLVASYGADPDATWLVDWHDLWVVPTVNPDRCTISRRNANDVDLNRNHDFKWSAGAGHGAFPRSEPEIAGLEDLIASLIPDQRGPGDTDAAPDDATGIYVTLHTPFGSIGHPWAWSSAAAPNAGDLAAVGRKLAAIDGYTAGQSNDIIYPMAGCGSDWAYGTLGIAALIVELAPAHNPEYALIDEEIWPANHEALVYAAKIARAPYLTVHGPDTHDLEVEYAGDAVSLSALIDDLENGMAPIGGAELYVDAPPWTADAAARALEADDGAFDSVVEVASGTIEVSALDPGRHLALVRGVDADGNWGPFSAAFFTVNGALGTDAGAPHPADDPPDAETPTTAPATTAPAITATAGGCACRAAPAPPPALIALLAAACAR